MGACFPPFDTRVCVTLEFLGDIWVAVVGESLRKSFHVNIAFCFASVTSGMSRDIFTEQHSFVNLLYCCRSIKRKEAKITAVIRHSTHALFPTMIQNWLVFQAAYLI